RIPELLMGGMQRRQVAISHVSAPILARPGRQELFSAWIAGVEIVGVIVGIPSIYVIEKRYAGLAGILHALDYPGEHLGSIEVAAHAHMPVGDLDDGVAQLPCRLQRLRISVDVDRVLLVSRLFR